MAVQDGVDAVDDLGGGVHTGRQVLQVGVDALLHRVKEVQCLAQGVQQGAQLAQRQQVDGRILADRLQEGDGVDVAGGGEALLEHQDEAHFIGQQVAAVDFRSIGAEFFLGHAACRVVGGASALNGRTHLVKAQFRFQPAVHLLLFLLCHERA